MSDILSSNEQRWKLAPWRIIEIRAQANTILSSFNINECVALRDMIDDGLPSEHRAAHEPEDGEPTLADWAPAIRDCLLICRDLIDGKNIDPKFLRISIQTILDEWPPVTKGDSRG